MEWPRTDFLTIKGRKSFFTLKRFLRSDGSLKRPRTLLISRAFRSKKRKGQKVTLGKLPARLHAGVSGMLPSNPRRSTFTAASLAALWCSTAGGYSKASPPLAAHLPPHPIPPRTTSRLAQVTTGNGWRRHCQVCHTHSPYNALR